MTLLKWLFTCKLKSRQALKDTFKDLGPPLAGCAIIIAVIGFIITWSITVGKYLRDDPDIWSGDFTLWIIWSPIVIGVYLALKFLFCEQD